VASQNQARWQRNVSAVRAEGARKNGSRLAAEPIATQSTLYTVPASCKTIAKKASGLSIRVERTRWPSPASRRVGIASIRLGACERLTQAARKPTTSADPCRPRRKPRIREITLDHLAAERQAVSSTLTCIREAAFAVILQLAGMRPSHRGSLSQELCRRRASMAIRNEQCSSQN
jgi:hypothetical protein